MAKYFPITRVRTKVVEVPVGDVGEVGENRLQMDTRERQKKAINRVSLDSEISEQAKRAAETVTAALAAEMTEVNKKTVESISVEAITQDQAKRAEDSAEMTAVVGEQGRKADDAVHAIIVPTADQAKRAIEDINAQVNAIVFDQAKRSIDYTAAEVETNNQGKRADDTIVADIAIQVNGKRAVETINAEFNANLTEQAKRATDMIEAAIIARTDIGKRAADQKTIIIDLTGYITEVISNTGFTNPNNTIGNTTDTNAALTASASGLAGLTSNTTNGTLHARFRDTNLSDLTITAVTINVETSATQGGLPLGGGWAVDYQYSLDNGSTWTTFHTTSAAEGKGARSATITTPVGGSWANINQLRVRATGSVTSGTGLGATRSALWYRSWVTITANRIYS